MIKFDDEFIREVGLEGLSPKERASLLQHVCAELELRVGKALSAGLTLDQMDEFERLIDGDMTTIAAVLERCGHEVGDGTDLASQSEAAASLWLSENRPAYQSVVAEQLDVIKAEVKASASLLLTADGAT